MRLGSVRTTSVITSPGCTAAATTPLFAGSRRLSSAVNATCHAIAAQIQVVDMLTLITCHEASAYQRYPCHALQLSVSKAITADSFESEACAAAICTLMHHNGMHESSKIRMLCKGLWLKAPVRVCCDCRPPGRSMLRLWRNGGW